MTTALVSGYLLLCVGLVLLTRRQLALEQRVRDLDRLSVESLGPGSFGHVPGVEPTRAPDGIGEHLPPAVRQECARGWTVVLVAENGTVEGIVQGIGERLLTDGYTLTASRGLSAAVLETVQLPDSDPELPYLVALIDPGGVVQGAGRVGSAEELQHFLAEGRAHGLGPSVKAISHPTEESADQG